MKRIVEYKIPKHYKDIIENFYNFLTENYRDKILLFTLSGSTVFENIVENVSDIDYILILKDCTPDDYRKIYQYKNQFDIKIGGSIFTANECKNKQIDYLAMYYLYLINIGNIEPIYMSNNFENNITKDDMLESIRNVEILNLRTLKKMVYSRNIKDTKLLMKNILFLEKDFLILNDMYCTSKSEIVDKFNEMFNLQFDLSIFDCLNNSLSNEQFDLLLKYIDEVIVELNDVDFKKMLKEQKNVGTSLLQKSCGNINKRIFTGNYEECKVGNLISISGDRGRKVGYIGKALPKLAPKKAFLNIFNSNIGKIPEEQNIRYYIEEYYKQVLSKVDIEELLKDEKDPILLCYEKGQDFCHRHVLAEYIEMKYGIKVRDIKIDKDLNIAENQRPGYIRTILEDVISKEQER